MTVIDEIFQDTLKEAIAEWLEIDKTLNDQVTRWRRLRAAILAISNQLGIDVPPEVLASLDKRTVDVRRNINHSQSHKKVAP